MSSMNPVVNTGSSVDQFIPLHKPTLGYRVRAFFRTSRGRRSHI